VGILAAGGGPERVHIEGRSLSLPGVKLLLDRDADEWDGWNWWLLGFKGLTSAERDGLTQRAESAG
jgi:hypothetical protein